MLLLNQFYFYTLQDLLDVVRTTFHIGQDQAPGGVDGISKEILTLRHAGADLQEQWILADVGIDAGTNIYLDVIPFCPKHFLDGIRVGWGRMELD